MVPLPNWNSDVENCDDMIGGLTLGSEMEGKYWTDGITHNNNEDVNWKVDEATEPGINDMGGVMENHPWVLGDDGIGCDIVDESLIVDTVVWWWTK